MSKLGESRARLAKIATPMHLAQLGSLVLVMIAGALAGRATAVVPAPSRASSKHTVVTPVRTAVTHEPNQVITLDDFMRDPSIVEGDAAPVFNAMDGGRTDLGAFVTALDELTRARN